MSIIMIFAERLLFCSTSIPSSDIADISLRDPTQSALRVFLVMSSKG